MSINATTLSILFIAFLLVNDQVWAHGDKCAPLLGGAQNEGSISEQGQIAAKEREIHALVQAYKNRLGPYQDAFALAFSQNQADKIFQRLSVRARGEGFKPSPLAIIIHSLKNGYAQSKGLNWRLIQWVEGDAKLLLSNEHTDRADLQSDLLALQFSLEYLRRYKEPEVIVDREGKPEVPPIGTDQKQQEQSEQDSPPEYPDLPKEYKPFTKDTQNKNSSKQKEHRISEVNFKTPFFAQRYFANIDRRRAVPFSEAVLPIAPNSPAKYQQTPKEMVVRTFGKRTVDLFLPPLFKPLQPSDPRATITRSETGGFILTLKSDLNEVRIPLVEDQDILMLPPVQEVYTRPVGFKNEEWPVTIQADILRKYSIQEGKQNSLRVAQAIADHIATEYLYSVGPRPETDPIAALKAGAFQCDMAAFTMLGLLRDVYGIPSRVVGGFRAKRHQGTGDHKSYLVVPGEAHAWVEVFADGKWHLFDPTPVKKDRKDDQTGQNEYSDIQLENTPKSKDQDHQQQPSTSEPVPQGDRQDHQKRLDQDTESRMQGLWNKVKGLWNKDEKTDKTPDQKQSAANEEGLTREELAAQLELGSLELEPRQDRNILLERAMRVLLRIAIEPTQRGFDIQNRLSQISSILRRFNSVTLKEIYQTALSAHTHDHPELKTWIDQLVHLMPSQDINRSYQELYRIRQAIEVYARVLDRGGKIPMPEKLMEILNRAQKNLDQLAHLESQDIALVQELVKNLPAVARLLLKNEFNLSAVGANAPTKEIAKKIKTGAMKDLRLLSILSPLSDFILNSTPRPDTTEVKTWQRDSRRQRGRDLLPLQRFSDLPRAIMGQPGKTIEANIMEGTAFVPTRRQRVQIPAGFGNEEAERITIVLYDTSGSMNGDPGRFQAGLISAFTARALSDVSPSGRHRHRVILVPFDDSVGEAVPVTNTQDALNVIRNYQQKLKNTGGGTDIQKALIQAMALIADAEKRSGEPLSAANIILMTDGQADISPDELLRARQAIDRQTPLQTMFIAINQTNEELMRFAMDSQKMGAERGFYREFTPEHIHDILREADTVQLRKDAFYSDKNPNEAPQEVYQLLRQALSLAGEFTDQIHHGILFMSARDHLASLEKLKWRDVQHLDRPLEKWLIKLRQFVMHPIFQDTKVLQRVMDDLINEFERLTGIPVADLGDHEQEQLRHLVRFAAGLESGI